jgi:hypothetical protein
VITTNCSNNYGPYHFPEKLIPLMIVNALAGKPLPIYGDGMQVRDWLYVKDHCSAIRRVLEAVCGHDRRYAIDARKLENELGWEARRDLRVRHPQDRAVVPGQPGVGGKCAEWGLSGVGWKALRNRSERKIKILLKSFIWSLLCKSCLQTVLSAFRISKKTRHLSLGRPINIRLR